MPRILLVDGNADDRQRVRDLLKGAGHDVVGAPDATTAIEKIDQRSFDMVMTEWMLRDMSGLELAHYVRRHPNGSLTRVLMLSDHANSGAVAHALEPHAFADLLQTVRGFGYRFG